MAWSRSPNEFVRRAGFAIMATAAATDHRDYVKKAVNWALRQIGKRNQRLNGKAIATAKEFAELVSRTARWVASDALRELTGPAVHDRLRRPRRNDGGGAGAPSVR